MLYVRLLYIFASLLLIVSLLIAPLIGVPIEICLLGIAVSLLLFQLSHDIWLKIFLERKDIGGAS